MHGAWLAHGSHFNAAEMKRIGRAKTTSAIALQQPSFGRRLLPVCEWRTRRPMRSEWLARTSNERVHTIKRAVDDTRRLAF